ncbi:SpoIIE family protein phosphatase [Acaryochloris sp. IP29b_bin.148]|uniref:PP2C family protein-serine/threonine phosphatase n=1 Tax=Acaryochloris sp. IP29b_bin.148 TaxID=2969218 RepID=UPI00261D3E03|nr:SpoIIE family protein phosphatase [Acaryochloris sp. IP29b_bin.148]
MTRNNAMVQILIIDDDPITQLLIRRALEKQGYQVAVAANGQDGLARAKQTQPALVICDWMMPVLDGIEVCQHLKSTPYLSATFFILLTSRSDLEDRIAGLNAGADEFLTKPIDMSELQARVRAGLRIYHLHQDLQTQKQKLETALAEAAQYVHSILPAPLESPIQITSRFIPSQQLGGDCFDYYWLTPETLVVYLLDVSGHGLGAALPSVSILNMLRSQAFPGINYEHPHEVLHALNLQFAMSQENPKYLTIWYGVYHHLRRELVYASAGHPPALLVSNSQTLDIQPLKTPGLPLGMFTESQYVSHRCHIAPEQILYIFSDGIYEIHQPNDAMLGLEGFSTILKQLHQQGTPSIEQLLAQIQQRCNSPGFTDDLALMQVSFCEDASSVPYNPVPRH